MDQQDILGATKARVCHREPQVPDVFPRLLELFRYEQASHLLVQVTAGNAGVIAAFAPRLRNWLMRGVAAPSSDSVRPTTLMTAVRFMGIFIRE